MPTDETQIERLRVEIELRRAALMEQRAEVQHLQQEIAGFAQLYARIVGPLEAELDSVRQQIEEIELLQNPVSHADPESIWGPGFSSFEESFDAKYRRQDTPVEPSRRIVDESALRTLYRKLARQYHPDTSIDPAERARLTILMAQINAAYRARNLDELKVLDGQPSRKPIRAADMSAMPRPPRDSREQIYLDLVEQKRKLDDEIELARIEHQRLMTSPLMMLKIEHSLARNRGRDLLREITVKIRADLQAAKAELATLRRKR